MKPAAPPEEDESAVERPRARTVAHMRTLMATATILGAANGVVACGKTQASPPKDAGDESPDAAPDIIDTADHLVVPEAAAPLPDASATAESTLDATTFAGPDAAKKRAGGGTIRRHGYVVVDPLPRPTRLPKNKPPPDGL